MRKTHAPHPAMKERMKSLFANILSFPRREAPDVARLREITAAQIPMAEAAEVEISDVRRGNETLFWRATYRARSYHCHADGLFLRVTVTRAG